MGYLAFRAIGNFLNNKYLLAAQILTDSFSIHGKVLDYAPDAVAEISVNGRLRVFIPITAYALCPINVKYFPFDIQNCTFAVSRFQI